MLGFFSCGKEALVDDLPLLAENSISDRNASEDCNCEMQILRVNNASEEMAWKLSDIVNNGNDLFYGMDEYLVSTDQTQNNPPSYQIMVIPSEFVVVSGPNTIFQWDISMDFNDIPPKFYITIKIVCTGTDDDGNTTSVNEFIHDLFPGNNKGVVLNPGLTQLFMPLPFQIGC